MEFVANYDAEELRSLVGAEGQELQHHKLNFGDTSYSFTGRHNALIVGGGLNVAVDMKVVVLPSGKISKVAA
ncbi:MAG: hypothetical protein V8Q42_09060 [Anaerovoracaceae bacterium]